MPRPAFAPEAGALGGPGMPGRFRVGEATLTSSALMETDNFNRFIKLVERSDQQVLEKLTEDMAKRARAKAPVRTGRLRMSIKPVMLNNGREGRVTSSVPYAVFQEHGTGPHLIHGVRANFWYTGEGQGGLTRGRAGAKHFTWNNRFFGPVKANSRGYKNWTAANGATVRHPGNKAVHFFRDAYDEVWPTARFVMHNTYKRNGIA